MTKILHNDYVINRNTQALLPGMHMDYDTKVIETNQILYVNKRIIEIVKNDCLEGGSTYDGRRIAVTKKMGFGRKQPIPIYPHLGIIAFPTKSPDTYDCVWIFPQHVKRIITTPTGESEIFFKDGQSIVVNESRFVLEKQIQRSAICILIFKGEDSFPA
ncbi:competence protein ComK [Bacillaceae bacterium S4-13-56]